jgi:hypothetical protein
MIYGRDKIIAIQCNNFKFGSNKADAVERIEIE